MNHLCIIGAGATGVALLNEIVRRQTAQRVTLFDPRPPGQGLAFASPHDWHLCNTSTGTMSLDTTDPGDFCRWLQDHGQDGDANHFTARSTFHAYVADKFFSTIEKAHALGIELRHVHEKATTLVPRQDGTVEVIGCAGTRRHAQAAVLCPGVGRPTVPPLVRHLARDETFFASPYSQDFDEFLATRPGARVLILGTKLSGIDAAITCLHHEATAVMSSPSGQLPSVRSALTLNSPFPITRDAFATMSNSPPRFRHELLNHLDRAGRDFGHPLREQVSYADGTEQRLREETALAESHANLWQYAIGELIDLASDVWTHLPKHQMRKLIASCHQWIKRYVSSMPVGNAQQLANAMGNGILSVRRLPTSIEPRGTSWRVEFADGVPMHFDGLVCAVGYDSHPWSVNGAGTLTLEQQVQPRLPVDASLRVQTAHRRRAPNLWAMGDLSSNRYPVVNYMHTSVLQAQTVADGLARHEAPAGILKR